MREALKVRRYPFVKAKEREDMRTMRPKTDRPARRPHAPLRTATGAALALAALALLATGCGGTSPKSGIAHLGSSSPTNSSTSSGASSAGSGGGSAAAQLASEAVAYANCMRAHGVPNYPDPKVSVHGNSVSVAAAARPGPHFNSAQQACRKLLPGGGPGQGANPPLNAQEQAQVLKLAVCIRAHGEPNLPDPSFSGGGVHLPKSVNIHSPTFKSAEQACQSLIPSSLRGGEH
jgi:hypothetical protein